MAHSKGDAEGSGAIGLFTQMWAGLSQLREAVKYLGCYYLWVRIKNVGRGRFHILEDPIPSLDEGKRNPGNPISPISLRQNKKT